MLNNTGHGRWTGCEEINLWGKMTGTVGALLPSPLDHAAQVMDGKLPMNLCPSVVFRERIPN